MTVLVLATDGPMLFEKEEQAAAYMEPIDVRNGEYRVFDASGRTRRLRVTETEKKAAFGFFRTVVETVQIGESEENMDARAEAVEAISGYLHRVHGVRTGTPSFPEVVELLVQHEGYAR